MVRDRRLAAFKFKRQQIIFPYIVDFICLSRRLIIEADGSQHADSRYDHRRDAFLAGERFTILRFWNSDVLKNPAGVFDLLSHALTSPHLPTASRRAPPSPARGEGLDGAFLA